MTKINGKVEMSRLQLAIILMALSTPVAVVSAWFAWQTALGFESAENRAAILAIPKMQELLYSQGAAILAGQETTKGMIKSIDANSEAIIKVQDRLYDKEK